MKAVRLHAAGDLRVVDEPAPDVPDGHELVRVTAVGICGSDLHWLSHAAIGDAELGQPLVLGHEIAGVIEGGARDGRRVAVDPAIPCRRCEVCRTGDTNLCPAIAFAGHGRLDGGLREYLAWPGDLLHPLPDALSDGDGAMLEPLGVALHALDLGHLRVGMHVVVVGCGPIGLLLIQLARLAGAGSIAAVEPLGHRRDAARRAGADHAVADEHELTKIMTEHLPGPGFDLGFEVTDSGLAAQTAMAAVRPGARVVLVGIPDDDSTTFRASLARRKGLTLVLSRRMKDTYPRAISLVAAGHLDVASLVTGQFGLGSVNDAFSTAARRDGLKVLVHPTIPVSPRRATAPPRPDRHG